MLLVTSTSWLGHISQHLRPCLNFISGSNRGSSKIDLTGSLVCKSNCILGFLHRHPALAGMIKQHFWCPSGAGREDDLISTRYIPE